LDHDDTQGEAYKDRCKGGEPSMGKMAITGPDQFKKIAFGVLRKLQKLLNIVRNFYLAKCLLYKYSNTYARLSKFSPESAYRFGGIPEYVNIFAILHPVLASGSRHLVLFHRPKGGSSQGLSRGGSGLFEGKARRRHRRRRPPHGANQ